MNLGDKILNLRKKKGLSQEQLGERCDVTRQTISNWELGETSPNPDQLKKLSNTLEVSIDELLDNDITNILETKVSNTEKLAGMIIKILKVIGVLFLIFLIIDIISFILYVGVRKEIKTEFANTLELTCTLDDEDYLIDIGTDGYYNCSNCSKDLQEKLKNDFIDFGDMDKTEKNITDYFEKNNGSCE